MSFNFITQAKKLTHWIAGLGAMAVAWAVSEQGQSVIGGIVHAYPKASFLVGVIAFAATLYRAPK